MDRWVGRVAIVTGASAGIGATIACHLAKNGMKVVGVARRDALIKVNNTNKIQYYQNIKLKVHKKNI